MKLVRLSLAIVALMSLAGLAYVAQQGETSGATIVSAAQTFLDGLTGEQKMQATFPFESKERTNWFFTPQQNAAKKSTRKGLPLEEMKPEQKQAALALVKAGTSETGNVTANTIMSLESILRDQEKKGAMVRNPEWYFFTIFGTPAKTGKWGWRVEGHHLSINFTMDGSQVIASTPFFFGANPAEVKSGDKKGLRILAPVEDIAKQLYDSLSDEQKQVALQKNKKFPEPEEKSVAPKVGAPVGLAAGKMTDPQKQTLMKLLKSYTDRMPPDVAAAELRNAREAGMDNVHFAFTGSTEAGKGLTYRVQGPTFVIEFLNVQADSAGNANNHIHSAWRRIKGDFGINQAMRVKICGITDLAGAKAAVECGADALGLNFYARSPRYVTEGQAAAILSDLPPFVEPVALFVNETFAHMSAVTARLQHIRTIQFHGDNLTPCPPGPPRFIPAFGVRDTASLQRIITFIEDCRSAGQLPSALLLDAHVPGAFGGTGQTAPWSLLADFQPGIPIILAGGLTPDNVAEAIRLVRPYGVDVASGVEKSPGQKDVDKMRRFIDNARAAASTLV